MQTIKFTVRLFHWKDINWTECKHKDLLAWSKFQLESFKCVFIISSALL